MTVKIIYILITLILIYVMFIGFKAAQRGLKAKSNLKNSKNASLDYKINNLKKLYNDGTLTKKEFINAKKKLLK